MDKKTGLENRAKSMTDLDLIDESNSSTFKAKSIVIAIEAIADKRSGNINLDGDMGWLTIDLIDQLEASQVFNEELHERLVNARKTTLVA